MQIDTRTFFLLGIWAFAIIGVCNLGTLIIFFPAMHVLSIISSIAGMLFNFATAGFFYYLLGTAPKTSEGKTAEEEDLKAMFGEITYDKNNKEKKKK